MPFAIVGSEEEVEIDGEQVRARIYPWGIAEVDNPKHSDFPSLRRALLKYVALNCILSARIVTVRKLAPIYLISKH